MIRLLRISWPSPDLNDNRRVHWAVKARAKKAYREEAWAEALNRGILADENAVLRFEFYPPDRRRRDTQNLPGMMKAAIDGIADAMGCDDHKFQCVFPSKLEEPVKPGSVLIEVKTRD